MIKANPPFSSADVAAVYEGFPEAVREALLSLRELVFDVAEATPGVGALEECLKWGQPAYVTSETKAGSPLRLAASKQGGLGVFVHCATRIIPDFKALFPERFRFDGTRGVLFEVGEELPVDELRMLVASALTYHARKKFQPA
ncbi:DUF1801 domain-containing protein [Vannielia litorea]|uniref:DUF1801 domain-containing protein n=1 Tax=Vannielia litorea TaxID=1217970 RepID=UPI001BCB4F20|nr:DUF1801 domain-containing protein [Vannielia litorea]MBS8229063.1 DUF1801 domain-containing protein [Vannielia litorea]